MLKQVIADIEKEAGSFYGQVSSRRQGSGSGSGTGNQRMQRGALETSRANQIPSKRVCLEVRVLGIHPFKDFFS